MVSNYITLRGNFEFLIVKIREPVVVDWQKMLSMEFHSMVAIKSLQEIVVSYDNVA